MVSSFARIAACILAKESVVTIIDGFIVVWVLIILSGEGLTKGLFKKNKVISLVLSIVVAQPAV
jgi:hypothetical protein